MTRKEFLGSMAGAAGYAALQSAAAPSAAGASMKAKFHRGVSLYSYNGDFHSTMTLEDCFREMDDMGARSLEILSEQHVPDYPNPSNAWVDHWYEMLEKYRITPACYSAWQCDTGTPQECLDWLVRDMRLASRLGFKYMRSKVAGGRARPGEPAPTRVGPGFGYPVDAKWEEWVLRALPFAEKLDVRFTAGEMHTPTLPNSPWVQDVVAFLQKNKTEYFGLMFDTGILATRPARLGDSAFESDPAERAAGGRGGAGAPGGAGGRGGAGAPGGAAGAARPIVQAKELLPLMPYMIHFHFKFWEMLDDFTEYSVPFDQICAVLIESGYDKHCCSEYEGPRTQGLASIQLRRQHVMLKRILGESA